TWSRSRAFLEPSLLRRYEGDLGRLLHPRGDEGLLESLDGGDLDAARVLAHRNRRDRGFGLQLRAAYEHDLHVADERAARETPPSLDAVVGHGPLHAPAKIGERLRGQGVDALGDAALRFRQAPDVG